MRNMLFIIACLFISTIVKSQDICVWGRNGTMEIMNGKWTLIGEYNNSPYYKLNIDKSFSPATQYLWRDGSQYKMTDYAPNESGFGYSAKCMINTTNPIDCSDNWRIGTETSNDINIFIQPAPCPQWECDAITIEIEPMCSGLFNNKINSNAWSNDKNVTFYFHSSHFRWVCASKYDLTLNYHAWAWTKPNWIDFDTDENEESIDLYFEFPSNDKGYHTINCITNYVENTLHPSEQPTMRPTFIKTTENKNEYKYESTIPNLMDPNEIFDNVNNNNYNTYDFNIATLILISTCVVFIIGCIGICGYLYGKGKRNNSYNNNQNQRDNSPNFSVINSKESTEKIEIESIEKEEINNIVIPGINNLRPPKAPNSDGYKRVMVELEGVLGKRKNLNKQSSKSEELYGKGDHEISDDDDELEHNGGTTPGEAAHSFSSITVREGLTKDIGDI